MTITGFGTRFGHATRTALLALALSAITAPAFAGSNMEKVDIVPEGIDLKPLYVGANANGYTGTENNAHTFLVRVYAKAKGQNRVWSVSVVGAGSTTVLFKKEVGKSEGWATYSKSLQLAAKPRDLKWLTVPVEVCWKNMDKLIAEGSTKAKVLANDRKVTAYAQLGFRARADSKAHNMKDQHDSEDGFFVHRKDIVYPVPVVCRAAL